MAQGVTGLDRVNTIRTDPHRTVDFYAGVLGSRPVKKTVNLDEPIYCHLYYDDANVRLDGYLTFFLWPRIGLGQSGSRQATEGPFATLTESLRWGIEHVIRRSLAHKYPTKGFGEGVLSLMDPDGLLIELVASRDTLGPTNDWNGSTVPCRHWISYIPNVPLSLAGYEKLAALLTDLLGFREVVAEANSFCYAVGEGGPGTQVDRRWKPGFWPGTVGASSVHPVGRRVPDAQAQGALFRVLVDEQFDVSPVLDQRYFCFAYFRESSRTRVEIATDPPGFAVDEEEAAGLGERPVLSPWPEQMRLRIEERSARQFARETGA